ncbi:transposase [Paenibacillus sp. NRS-1760]
MYILQEILVFFNKLQAPLENIDTFTCLHRRLDVDLGSRYHCRLRLDREAPSVATLIRIFAEKTNQELAKRLFNDLVTRCMQEAVIDGSHMAVDSAAIHSYEKKQPKRKLELTGNANWGAKFDSFRNKAEWFGYKLHLAVDTTRALPMTLSITPDHVNDGDMAPGSDKRYRYRKPIINMAVLTIFLTNWQSHLKLDYNLWTKE